MNKASGDFTNKWGAFMERLISGDLINLFEQWNIPVDKLTSRKTLYRESRNVHAEYDFIAYNGDVLVVVEVKSTFTRSKLDKFLLKLADFKKDRSGFADKTLYGAVGFLECEEGFEAEAEKEGLFVIRAPGGNSNSSTMLNDREHFLPKEF